ncbi:hypothetical protein WJ438_38085 [Streptomyces sp. GD-15H]|uniref:hypothetical protein n=1 Tax=Streptomyces sp. GD-15H TaxID=3129112 RepID=UPI0032490F62
MHGREEESQVSTLVEGPAAPTTSLGAPARLLRAVPARFCRAPAPCSGPGSAAAQTTAGCSPKFTASHAPDTRALGRVVVSVPGLSHFFGSRPLGPAAWTIAPASAAGSVPVPLAVRGAAGALGKVHPQHTRVQPAGRPRSGQRSRTPHATHERRRAMPHILTTVLTQVAVALLEAAVVRLAVRLWRALGTSGRPAAAHA